MKEPHQQDLFDSEKPRKKEKKVSDLNSLELDFSTAQEEETPKHEEPTQKDPVVSSQSVGPDTPRQPIEEKQVVNLAKHGKKKTDSEKSSSSELPNAVEDQPPLQTKSQKTLHELKKQAKKQSEHVPPQSPLKLDENLASTEQEIKSSPVKEEKKVIAHHEGVKTHSQQKVELEEIQHPKSQPKIIKQSSPILSPTQKKSAPQPPVSNIPSKQLAKHLELPEGGSIGHILQEARVKAGLSIDQVAIETKIKKSYIEAIERDDLKSLPGSAFINAYIRRLCQQYGIDESIAKKVGKNLRLKGHEPQVPLEVLSEIEKGKQVNEEKKKRLKTFYTILTILIISAISLLIIVFLHIHLRGKRKPLSSGAAPSQAQPATKLTDEEAEKILREILVRHPYTPLTELQVLEK